MALNWKAPDEFTQELEQAIRDGLANPNMEISAKFEELAKSAVSAASSDFARRYMGRFIIGIDIAIDQQDTTAE